MRVRIRHLWELVTTSYWFVPAMMVLAATLLAFALLYVDQVIVDERIGWLYAGGADGAKTMLSTIASSVITVAGVVFSITIAALTQASSQFGPRLLRNFMRDTGNQVVLGTFVATFIYCLLVLRTIHGEVGDRSMYVPHASVSFAVVLAAASIAVLIYFIHHVSISLQAPSIIAAVLDDLEGVIAKMPKSDETDAQIEEDVSWDDRQCSPVPATKRGYIQVVDYDALAGLAEECTLAMKLEYKPGDYLTQGTPLLRASPTSSDHHEDFVERCNAAFICGRDGSAEQDVEYAVRQMVEIAVRALSPGINDPFTAINCVDALGSAICSVARRTFPSPRRYGPDGSLRLLVPTATFEGFVDMAFNQIRQYGRSSVAVMLRMLEVIVVCAHDRVSHDQRACLMRHARLIHTDAIAATTNVDDRATLDARWQAVAAALE